jgi:L-fuconolactonase
MSSTLRIDAHHHVWDLTVRDQPWTATLPALSRSFAYDDLLPLLDCWGIDRTVLVHTLDLPGETPEMLALAAEQPRIGGVVGWVDLTADDVDERLASLAQGPGGRALVGVRHQVQEGPASWLARTDVRRGLAALGTAGLTYDVVVTWRQLDAAIDAVAGVPETSFVLDHAGKPSIARGEHAPWAALMARLAVLPNVTVKLSGLVTEAPTDWMPTDLAPYVSTLLDTFGPDRTMFGSDWPVCLMTASYDDVLTAAEQLTAGLSPTEADAVFGGTASRVYGIKP